MDKELEAKMKEAVHILEFGVVLEFKHKNMEPDEIAMEFGGKLYIVRFPREVSKGE